MDNLRSPAIAAGAAHPRATPANSRHDTRQDGLGCVPVPSVPQGQEVAAMSTILGNKPLARGGLADKLAFYNGLQSVTNAIHATTHLDEIMLDLGREICSLFGADRLTIYIVCDGGKSIVTKIKTGLNSYKDFKLPVTDQSVAGYAAFHKRIVNIRDVYDANELALYSPHPNFLRLVDAKTGYHTRQMLVAPVVEAQTGDLVGVVQLINTTSGEPFPEAMEEGVALLCETLAIALRQRQRPVAPIRGKYDALIANAVISAEELELAAQSARRKSLDIETVLIDEFRVKPGAIGEALAAYFDVPYEPFRADRIKPFDLLRNLSREFLESSGWVPIDDTKEGMVVLTTDPERLRGSRAVNNIYPKGRIVYRVCCNREFATALDQLFGAATNATDRESIGDLLSDMHEDGGEEAVEDMKSAAADNEIVKLVNKVIVDAYQQGASDIHIEPYPGRGKTEIRFRKDGMLQPYISVPHGYRRDRHASRSCATSTSRNGANPRTVRSSSGSSARSISNCVSPPCRRRAAWKTSCCASSAPASPSRSTSSACPGATWRCARRRCRSPTACSSCAGRPGPARRRRCIRCSATSIGPRRRSGPPRIPWKSRSADCARCR
jgi:hypothetical protein